MQAQHGLISRHSGQVETLPPAPFSFSSQTHCDTVTLFYCSPLPPTHSDTSLPPPTHATLSRGVVAQKRTRINNAPLSTLFSFALLLFPHSTSRAHHGQEPDLNLQKPSWKASNGSNAEIFINVEPFVITLLPSSLQGGPQTAVFEGMLSSNARQKSHAKPSALPHTSLIIFVDHPSQYARQQADVRATPSSFTRLAGSTTDLSPMLTDRTVDADANETQMPPATNDSA